MDVMDMKSGLFVYPVHYVHVPSSSPPASALSGQHHPADRMDEPWGEPIDLRSQSGTVRNDDYGPVLFDPPEGLACDDIRSARLPCQSGVRPTTACLLIP